MGSTSLTRIIKAAGEGDKAAEDALWAKVFDEVRAMAAAAINRHGDGWREDPTVVAVGAYMKLREAPPGGWQSRRHFFGAAVRAITQHLVDSAREAMAAKRMAPAVNESLSRLSQGIGFTADASHEQALHALESLNELERDEPMAADAMRMHHVMGLSYEEVAISLELESPSVVERLVRLAKAHVRASLKSRTGGNGNGQRGD